MTATTATLAVDAARLRLNCTRDPDRWLTALDGLRQACGRASIGDRLLAQDATDPDALASWPEPTQDAVLEKLAPRQNGR